MSEEIAIAAADLITVQQLRAELEAAKNLIDGMRRTLAELREQLATADAEIAAYAERAEQAEARETGLNLAADQYSESRDMWMLKANAEIARAALAGLDAYALYEAIQEALDCGCRGFHWVDIEGEAEAEACDLWIALDDRLQAFKNGEHPGAVLVNDLQRLCQAVRASLARGSIEDGDRALLELVEVTEAKARPE